MKLKVIVDPMHGSAAGCISDLFGPAGAGWIEEIRSERNPLFGGNPPEPLSPYLRELIAAVRASTAAGTPAVGVVFDGDGDRIAAVDETGRFCSTQLLMPLLIDHLARCPCATRFDCENRQRIGSHAIGGRGARSRRP
jgi:phosphomannomutase